METLLIVGASGRSAAHSALRAGLRPWCIDLFADADLMSICRCERLSADEYPAAIISCQRGEPAGPWMYTGGIENRPSLIRQLAAERPLWGNVVEAVKRARSPRFVRAALEQAGIPSPEVRFVADEVPTDGTWLLKPVASCGGNGIELWRGSGSAPRRRAYFQQCLRGAACSACYVGDGALALLLGVTRQLVGEAWLGARPFHYCGSIGPLPLDAQQRRAFERLGTVLTEACGLRGLFGVDCIMLEGVPWPVEVNPRYTASVEVLEQAGGVAALSLHRAAFERVSRPTASPTALAMCVGKAILFARRDFEFPVDGPWLDVLRRPLVPDEFRRFADIPPAGQPLACGAPVLSIFARASTPEDCWAELHRMALDLDQRLFRQ